jgi:large subunit ribosomal protein L7e
LLELTRLPATYSEKLSHTSPTGIKFIYFSYPTRETIRKLIYKRGYGKINHQRIPLSNNRLVDSNLGKHGISSLEDLVNEIHTVGPHFKEANNFLWTFKLRGPRGGFSQKRHPFQRRGDWGNREIYINDLVKRCFDLFKINIS